MQEQLFIQELYKRNTVCYGNFPDKEKAESFAAGMFRFLFGSYEGKYESEERLRQEYCQLKDKLAALLTRLVQSEEEGSIQRDLFFAELPRLYELLMKDAAAIIQFDPAAKSIEEVLVAYPGFFATAVYRMAHQLHRQGVPLLPRLLSEFAHSKTGIDIHPGAQIGESFFIDHGTGIVIGETTHIGNNVKIYQGVTLGALTVIKEEAASKRHPTIEDEVIIYSGATILGGKTVIGRGSVIGGNVWLTASVPPGSVVYHKSEVKIKDKQPFP
ncbi:MAG TPA: serine O-acetyltransferase EpsC, partial [Chitinophagaceae bacterium]|nr:serine O-acetyltransferase EpsC [Chitinophagaceae bacterium]